MANFPIATNPTNPLNSGRSAKDLGFVTMQDSSTTSPSTAYFPGETAPYQETAPLSNQVIETNDTEKPGFPAPVQEEGGLLNP